MKKARIIKKDNKEEVSQVEESYSFKNFVLIIIALLIVFAIFYFITILVVKSNKNDDSKNTSITVIDSSKITINQLLDRKEEEYYVLLVKPSLYDSYAIKMNYDEIYDKYINDYSKEENSLKFYRVDLDDAFNKHYIGDKSNIIEDLESFKLGDEALIKINNKHIEAYYIGKDQIVEALSNLK